MGHLHALTHKGSADDGKRFSSDGRCMKGSGAFLLNLGEGSGEGVARDRAGKWAGGFMNIEYYRGRMVTFGVGSFFIFLLLLSV